MDWLGSRWPPAGNFKRKPQAGDRRLGRTAVGGVNTAKCREVFHPFAGLGDPINTDIAIDFGFLRKPPTAEVADDFADDPRVASGNVTGFFRLQLNDDRRGMIKREFFVERGQIRALRGKHFIPFFAGPAGGQTISRLFARGNE